MYQFAGFRWAGGLLFGILVMGLCGCGETALLTRQYNNFTAYYNKFHNAQKAFQEGIQSIEESMRPVDRTEYVSIFLEPQQSGGGRSSPFDQAIQKSADVLREHPDSKWVDDALILIGKSYFYQSNYIGAAQKFREAIALQTDRAREARFWLARTLVTNGDYAAADEVLRVAEGTRETSDDRWTAQLYLVRGELLVQQEQWEMAVDALQQGLEGDVPDEPASRASFLLGQVQETLGSPEAARTAYRRVRRYDPSYNLGFAARMCDIELQGMHGNPEAALDRLEDLESDDKNYEKRGEMALVRARIYRAQGQYDRARKTLKKVLYGGEETPSGRVEGRLHYDLASLYRDAYEDFSRAAAHFDTASTGLQSAGAQSNVESQRLPEAPMDATEQASRYRKLAERAREVARMDSLLRIGRMSDREFRAFVEELQRKRQRAREEVRQEAAQTQRFRQRGQAMGEERRSTTSAADTRQSGAGFLFYQDPSRVQQGRQQFRDTWGDRPRVDNWRRRNAISTSTASRSDTASGEREGRAPSVTDPIAQVASPRAGGSRLDLSGIPRDSSSQAKMEAERAVARYEFANSLFLAAGRPDSAATWYRRILQQNGDHPVAKRALYALAEAYRAQGDTTAAQQAYLRLIDQHPDTKLAERARERLDRSTTDPTETVAARADSAYARAYRRWQMGEWRTALDSMLSIAGRHPDTDAAPRALLASGIIYWQRTQVDSIAAPRSLVDRHLQVLTRRRSGSSADSSSTERTMSGGSEKDLLGTPSDSVRAAQDSLTTSGARDVLRAEAADTTRAQDSARTESQQRAPSSDSLRRAAADSRQAVPDSGDVASRQVMATPVGEASDAVGKSDVYTPLKTLLDHLTEQYSDAPQVKRARILLSMIKEQRAPEDSATTDTTIADPSGQKNVPPADSAALAAKQTPPSTTSEADADSAKRTAVAVPPTDSTSATAQPTDSSANRAASADREPLPAPTDPRARSSRSVEQGQPSAGEAWALLVDRLASSREASVRVEALSRQLGQEWNVEMIQSPNTEEQRFLLLIGRFSSEKAAVAARKQLQGQVSGSLEVYQRPDPGGQQ